MLLACHIGRDFAFWDIAPHHPATAAEAKLAHRHILNLTATSTGDGIIAGLQVITAMLQSDLSLHDLAQGMKKYPQVLINVKYEPSDEDYLQHEQVLAAVAAAELEMGKSGRVLLRKSGTEPLIRVMVEAEDAELAQKSADAIADTVKSITTQ